MDEVHHDGHGELVLLRQPLEMIDLRRVAVYQGDPPFVPPRITVCRLLEHRRDYFLERLREASPDTFVFWPGPRRLHPPPLCVRQNLLRRAGKGLDRIW